MVVEGRVVLGGVVDRLLRGEGLEAGGEVEGRVQEIFGQKYGLYLGGIRERRGRRR